MQRFKITREGYNKLKGELDNLINVERPKISKAIGEAIELGDLSENAEYHYSKDKQRVIEGMITNLTEKISNADVVDISRLSGNVIDFGATVLLVDEDTEKEVKYKILSEVEADSTRNIISINSPIGKALIGKSVGDSIEIVVPSGVRNFEVLEVMWIE
ncbi:MAG: transcription elongation factor GreA [Rickettsiales bacterium]|nr:transcription elongation factor GreA [Rickettsiales bacterium]